MSIPLTKECHLRRPSHDRLRRNKFSTTESDFPFCAVLSTLYAVSLRSCGTKRFDPRRGVHKPGCLHWNGNLPFCSFVTDGWEMDAARRDRSPVLLLAGHVGFTLLFPFITSCCFLFLTSLLRTCVTIPKGNNTSILAQCFPSWAAIVV